MRNETVSDHGNIPVAQIVEAIKSIRHGYVQIIVQDGKVVQIDRTEKIRVAKQEGKGGGG
ncbi:MAG: YezD family protein [Nitrospinae bacterium]|nr:YezD family protein [Nitrospinota bacterium]